MRIRSLKLKNFKRFTDLELQDIPESAKLVLLIGANGSGKSSVFDAFAVLGRTGQGVGDLTATGYFAKSGKSAKVSAMLDLESGLPETLEAEWVHHESGAVQLVKRPNRTSQGFYGRSALRLSARVPVWQHVAPVNEYIARDVDAPSSFIDIDMRLSADVAKYVADFNNALRLPVFEGRQVNVNDLARQFITPLNSALERVFGGVGPFPQMNNIEESESQDKAPKFMFRKGEHQFSYDMLSLGEKQVFAVLLNLFVRKPMLGDTIIFVDELDLHLNTALQYALLEEIVERWIPETSQLWTASHSLGFIRYASQSDSAVIFDFDALDFDLPQALKPVPKESNEVLQVAVPKEYLAALFTGKRLIYCEGNDVAYFNSIGLQDTIFANGGNKFQIFARARDAKTHALMDRDYLTIEEIRESLGKLGTLHILPLYSIENFLFHPDNLAEVQGAGFDRAAYMAALCAEKNRVLYDLNFGIAKARDGYPQARDLTKDERAKYEERGRDVSQKLKSGAFDDFYPVFPMKSYATQLPQWQNFSRQRLAHTQWFAAQMTTLLANIPFGQAC